MGPLEREETNSRPEEPERPAVEVGTLPLPEEPDDLTENEILRNLVDGWGEQAGFVEVYRFAKKGGRQYLTRYDAQEFDLNLLQEEHGGGKYQVRLSTAKRKYLGAQTVEIYGAPLEVEKTPEGAGLVELFEKGQAEVRAMIEAVKNPPEAAEGKSVLENTLALLTAFQAMQAPYMEALLDKGRPKELSSKDMIDLLMQGINMGKEISPEADPYAGVVNAFLPPLTKVLAEGGRDPSTPQPNPPGERPRPVETVPRPPWALLLAPELPRLQKWASGGKDVELRAAVILDDLPEQAVPLLIEQLERGEEFVQEFFALFPATRPFGEWYRVLFRTIVEGWQWEEPEEVEEEVEGSEGIPAAETTE